MKYHKGQLTIVNLIALVIAFIIYFAFVPILTPMIDSTVNCMNGISQSNSTQCDSNTPNEYTGIITSFLYLVPFMLVVMLVVTGFNYAMPSRERYQ